MRECFEPVLGECLRPEPGNRPKNAALVAERLRTCKPPHHRFKAAVKWAGVAVAVGVVGLGSIMSGRTWQRRKELKARYAAMIAARAEALAGVHPRATELGGTHARGNAGKSRGK